MGSILMEVVTINILVKLQPLVEVNHLVRRLVLLLPDEQDEFEEERNPSKMIKNSYFVFFSLKRNHTNLWKIKMRPYLTEKKKKKKKKKGLFFEKKKKKKKKKK